MIYCFDIDETIFRTDVGYNVRSANESLIKKLNELYESGNTIIIQTGRHWNHLLMTIRQLSDHGIKYHSLVMGKPVADIYIDDKAVRPDEFEC